jgi:hypothetical protein
MDALILLFLVEERDDFVVRVLRCLAGFAFGPFEIRVLLFEGSIRLAASGPEPVFVVPVATMESGSVSLIALWSLSSTATSTSRSFVASSV